MAPQLYDGPGFPGLVDNGFYPADAQIAVGPAQLVAMTNTMVGVFARDGLRLAAFPMSQILGLGANDDLSDPQISWDQESQRWLATAMDLTTNSTEVSVSDTQDPRGGWYDYSFPDGSTLCLDQPRLGFSSGVLVVATELFDGNCHTNGPQTVQGAVILVIDKQALLAHASDVAATTYGPNPTYDNYVPVQMLGPSSVDYMASADTNSSTSSVVNISQIQGIPPNDTLVAQNTLLITALNAPPPAAERGGTLIDAGDDRINDASWLNGVLYLAADDQCTYANDRYLETCARVMEISTSGAQPSLIGENDIGFPNADAYYASLRPDQNGNLLIVFGYSSPREYPSIAVTAALGPIIGEQGGTFTRAIELAAGTAPTISRWGDYQGAAVDPTNPSVIWTVGQVADDIGSGSPLRWATRVDAVDLTSSLPYAFSHQVDPGFLYRGQTSQGQRFTIRPGGGGGHVASA